MNENYCCTRSQSLAWRMHSLEEKPQRVWRRFVNIVIITIATLIVRPWRNRQIKASLERNGWLPFELFSLRRSSTGISQREKKPLKSKRKKGHWNSAKRKWLKLEWKTLAPGLKSNCSQRILKRFWLNVHSYNYSQTNPITSLLKRGNTPRNNGDKQHMDWK